jgi:cohesin loading factor subunit SCC2
MNNMHPNNHVGPSNGLFAQPGTDNNNPAITRSRPFTLQESLPFSPQTSTIPFIPG